MDRKPDLPIIAFAAQKDWERWLRAEHTTARGLWLKIAKQGSGLDSVTYDEALRTALCYGWIDGQKRAFDERCWLQRFTPRRPRSRWSKINCEKATALVGEGRMKAAGLAQVEQAEEDGRWAAAYEGQRTAAVPEDLQHELEQNPRAMAFFEALDSANRYAILYRLKDAKRTATRERRMVRYVAMLNAHEKLHP